MITQSTQPDHPCTLSLDNPFAGAQECETAMQAINLNPGKYRPFFDETRVLTGHKKFRLIPGAPGR